MEERYLDVLNDCIEWIDSVCDHASFRDSTEANVMRKLAKRGIRAIFENREKNR